MPQSTRAPQDPSHAPGVSFRSSLKPHRSASIPDIPYGSGQGRKRSVSTASGAAPSSQQSSITARPSASSTGATTIGAAGKARQFTPSDAHKGIRVTSQSATEKKALQDNTTQNAGAYKQDHSTTIIASSVPQTQLFTPSAPLTVNAPIVPAGPQKVTAINTEALEDNLRDSEAALAASTAGGKQPTRSAMKGAQARSWADLVRPMNNVKLAEHTVKNIGLPEDRQEHDPAADAAMAHFQGNSPQKKRVHIAVPASSAASQASVSTATPSKAGAAAPDKSPRHDSPPPAQATAHHTKHDEPHAGNPATHKEHRHQHAEAASDSADAKSVKSTTSAHTHGSVLDHYVSKKARLEEILAGVENSHSSVLLYPRGLVNTGNACFMNAILQALLFTGPFYNLISLIGANTSQDLAGKTPLLDAMVSYLSEFRATKDNHSQEKEHGLRTGEGYEETPSAQYRDAFIPSIIYHALNHNHRFAQMGFYNPTSSANSAITNGSQNAKGNAPLTAANLNANNRLSQEDAHEFLGFFLDTIHEELLIKIEQHDSMIWQKATKGYKAGQDALARQSVNSVADLTAQPKSHTTSAVNGNADDEDWLEVGSKGKTATTRTTEQQESAVTRIFGGQLRSVLRCPGQKDSVTLEPYTSLQLEIHHNNVTSISDALALISSPETISDMTNKNKVLVEATKQVFIESLPPVLILHLKRFNYDARSGQVVKSHKIISFDTEFEVPKDCVAPTKRATLADARKNRYRLTGVVYHHGKSAAGGHYSVAMRQNNGRWVNIDDTTITPISADEVATDRDKETMRLSLPSAASLRGVPEKTAYLLFYQRI